MFLTLFFWFSLPAKYSQNLMLPRPSIHLTSYPKLQKKMKLKRRNKSTGIQNKNGRKKIEITFNSYLNITRMLSEIHLNSHSSAILITRIKARPTGRRQKPGHFSSYIFQASPNKCKCWNDFVPIHLGFTLIPVP